MSTPDRRHLLLYEYVDDVLERRAPHPDGHLSLVREWKERERIVMAGALGDPVWGAAIVFAVPPSEVERFVEADPYVAAGLVTRWRVEPWNLV